MTSPRVFGAGLASLLAVLLGVTASGLAQGTPGAPASVSQLEAAVQRDPGDPGAHVALGLAYWGQNDYPRALLAFRRAVEVGPGSAEAHNWLGVALSEKSDLPGAIAEFKKAVELDPGYGRAYTNLGSALATSGDYAEAVQVFRKALSIEPNSLGAHFNLGMALRETGHLEEATGHLRRAADAEPTSASFQYELGQTLRQRGDLAGAIAAFEKSLEINPEQRKAYYALGTALKQQGAAARRPRTGGGSPADDLVGARSRSRGAGRPGRRPRAAHRGARAGRSHAEAHNLLGFVLGQQRELSSALPHLERAVALRPESAEAHFNLGVALWYSGSRDRALVELRRSSSSILPPAAATRFSAPRCARRATSPEPGRACNVPSRSFPPPPPSTSTSASRISSPPISIRRSGQLETGLNLPGPWLPAPDWDAARLPPSARRSSRARAAPRPGTSWAASSAARAPTAATVASEFREAVRLQPGFAEAHNNLGLVLIQSGDDPGGIAAFREAVRIQPDYADAHANLGAALTQTDAEEAVRELEKAVALAPGSAKVRFNLAAAYGASPARGMAKEIEQLEKTIELDPTFARAHVALGKAYLRDGKVAEAVKALQEATRLSPESGEARYQLGLALARAGRKEEATSELQKGRELVKEDDRDRTASLDLAEGREALAKGDLDRATAKFRHAIQLRPDSSEAQAALAAVVEKQKALSAASDSGADDPARVAQLEGYIRESQWTGSRAAPRGLHAGAAPLLLGLVRPRIRPLLPAEGRGSDTRTRPVSRARREERRGPQDARPLADGHREVRRRAARVRAGHPLQAGLRRDPLQPGPPPLDSGQLAAGADGVRGGPAARPVVRRSAGRAGIRAGGARRGRRGGQRNTKRRRPQPRRARAVSPPPT